MKVIVIDDEKNIRYLIINFIKSFDLDIEVIGEAETGEEGIIICKKCKPDTLISDIRMPSLDGLEMLRKIKEINGNIKCIFISAYDDFEYAQTALKYGANGYLLKPIQEGELFNSLNHIYTQWFKEVKEKNKFKKLETEIKKLKNDCFMETDKYVECKYSRTIQKVLNYIEENYHTDISLEKVSENVFLNKNYLSDLFRKEVGISFIQYLNDYKIQKAKILLKIGDFRTTEISDMVGFQNDSYFIKVFKRYTGYTPNEYKNCDKI